MMESFCDFAGVVRRNHGLPAQPEVGGYLDSELPIEITVKWRLHAQVTSRTRESRCVLKSLERFEACAQVASVEAYCRPRHISYLGTVLVLEGRPCVHPPKATKSTATRT